MFMFRSMFAPHSILADEPDAPCPLGQAPTADAADFWSRAAADERAAARVSRLQEMARVGLDLIVELRRLIIEDGAAGNLAGAYIGLSRAVRQSLALEAKLDGDAEARSAAVAAERAAAEKARQAAGARRVPVEVEERREQARRTLEEAIESAVDPEEDPVETERLYDALNERLADAADPIDDLNRPLSVVVAGICRDLGLTPDWAAWAEEDWALEEAEARLPGSAFLAVRDGPPDGDLDHHRAVPRPSWLAGQSATGPPAGDAR
jgi:hypothetical protein